MAVLVEKYAFEPSTAMTCADAPVASVVNAPPPFGTDWTTPALCEETYTWSSSVTIVSMYGPPFVASVTTAPPLFGIAASVACESFVK